MGREFKKKDLLMIGGSGRIRTHEIGTSYHTSFQVMAVMTASVRYHIGCGRRIRTLRPSAYEADELTTATIPQISKILSVLRA